MRRLRWGSKSHEKLATALRAMGHKVSASGTARSYWGSWATAAT